MIDFRLLKSVEIFSDLTPRQLRKILSICQEREFSQGERVVEQNTPSGEVYIILSGEIEILVQSEEEAAARCIAIMRAGQSFGEIALVDMGLRSASARCVSAKCRLLEISRDALLQLLQSDHKMGFRVLYNLAADLCLKMRRTTFLIQEDWLYRQPDRL